MRRATPGVLLLLTPVLVLAWRLPEPSWRPFGALPAEAIIDYTRLPGGLAPLSAAFFSRLYGLIQTPSDTTSPGSTRRTAVDPFGEERHGEIADDFEDAVRVNRVPFVATGDTRSASRQSNEPESCSRVGGTVWYRYTPRTDETLFANTFGSDHPTSLGVFRGTSMSSLTPVGCATDPRARSSISFPAARNETYYFQIGGPIGGALRFTLDRAGIPILASTGPTDTHQGDGNYPSISDDGHYVAFTAMDPMTPRAEERCDPAEQAISEAYEWAVQDTHCGQVYVRDLRTGTTTLVSVAPDGAGGNGLSEDPMISGDGNHVVFISHASDLVPGDTNGIADVFVRDLRRGVTERVSVTEDGEQAQPRVVAQIDGFPRPTESPHANNQVPMISRDGSVIAFASMSPNLTGDSGSCRAACHTIVVVDRRKGTLRNACLRPDGKRSSTARPCRPGSLSSSGRYLVFDSRATDLIDEPSKPSGQYHHVYIRDLHEQRTSRVSLSTDGNPADDEAEVWNAGNYAGARQVSGDGRWVVFSSTASNLVPGDSADTVDTFVRDRIAGVTIRVTPHPGRVGTSGTVGDEVSISDDGRIVVFASSGKYLPEDDNNFADVYARSIHTGALILLSSSTKPGTTGGGSRSVISGDGSAVAFASFGDLADEQGEVESQRDIFVRRLPPGFR